MLESERSSKKGDRNIKMLKETLERGSSPKKGDRNARSLEEAIKGGGSSKKGNVAIGNHQIEYS